MNNPINLYDSFFRALGCAALDPKLSGILIIDATYDELDGIASIYRQMIEAVSNKPIKIELLNTTAKDDDLWGRPGLNGLKEDMFQWHPGILANDKNENEFDKLIQIPDLSLSNINVLRAIIQTLGVDNIAVERHGFSFVSHQKRYWISRCSQDSLNKIPSHVLDRFDVKTHINNSRSTIQKEQYQNARFMNKLALNHDFFNPYSKLDDKIINQLQKAKQTEAFFPKDSINKVFEILDVENFSFSFRIPISLARLSIGYAMLDGIHKVKKTHVNEAARFLGFNISDKSKVKKKVQIANLLSGNITIKHSNLMPNDQQEFSISMVQEEQKENDSDLKVDDNYSQISNKEEVILQTNDDLNIQSMLIKSNKDDSFPESKQCLQLPVKNKIGQSLKGGMIIGYEPAKSLQDISIIHTLMESAKYQKIRNKYKTKKRFWISPIDFQAHRRARIPEMILILLIDFTCLHDEIDETPLLDQLTWAYSKRALIYLIRVGASDAYDELRAEKLLGQNILTPRINDWLEAEPGTATPLAHGLELVYQTLVQCLNVRYGNTPIIKVVILSDGRGNVTLEDSLKNQVTRTITREGIDDALKVAKRIQQFNNVEKIYLNPVPKYYKNIPLALANELKAKVIPIFDQDID